jgi:hypothetical protein
MNPQPDPRAGAVPPRPLAAVLRDAAAGLQHEPLPPGLKARVMDAATAAMADAAPPAGAADRSFGVGADRSVGGAADRSAGAAAARGGATRPGAAAVGRRRSGWLAWSGAGACAAVLAASALLMVRAPGPLPVDDGVRLGVADGFVPLVPPERWPREAAPAWLVRTEMQAERLAALGLPFDPGRAGERVPAELLLHPSGEVLAVRLVH